MPFPATKHLRTAHPATAGDPVLARFVYTGRARAGRRNPMQRVRVMHPALRVHPTAVLGNTIVLWTGGGPRLRRRRLPRWRRGVRTRGGRPAPREHRITLREAFLVGSGRGTVTAVVSNLLDGVLAFEIASGARRAGYRRQRLEHRCHQHTDHSAPSHRTTEHPLFLYSQMPD